MVWAALLALSYYAVIVGPQGCPTPAAAPLPVEVWAHRRFFFCVSPGRAGSKYLSAVLGAAKNVVARHEPEPKMNDEVLREVLIRCRRAESFGQRARVKVEAIQDVLVDTAPDVGYAETSHMFIKTFADVVLNGIAPAAANVTIIILQRSIEDVVLSQLRLGWFSANHSGYNVWYHEPSHCRDSELQGIPSLAIAEDSGFPQVDQLVAYNMDIARRARALEKLIVREHDSGRFRNVHVVRVRLCDLSSHGLQGVEAFLNLVGLKSDPDRLALLNLQDTNARTNQKERREAGYSVVDVRRRMRELLSQESLRSLVV
jgi:hypothetical protein